MRPMRWICILAAACFSTVGGVSSPMAGDDVEIIPAPKEIELTGKRFALVRDGEPAAIILLALRPSPQAQIGAAEINAAITAAAGVALPVKTLDTLTPAERAEADLIVIGQPGENQLLTDVSARKLLRVSPDRPGPQGYWIRFVRDGKRRLALMSGCDPVGMLYACVTFRYLVRGADKSAYAVEANVRDWPDVRWRSTWTTLRTALRAATGWSGRRPPPKPEEGLTLANRQLDWFLRHKINIFNCDGMPRADEQFRSWNRQVLQYAFERGIWGWTFGATSSLGEAPLDRPKPELDVCFVFKRRGLRYWCWSRDDMIRRRFEEEARALAANMPRSPGQGGMVLVLHMPDTGNMGWHYRCKRCKKRFGNDQGAAQANVFTLFGRAMRKYIHNSKLVLVPRPYVLFDFDAPANRVYRERFERLARLIPADSYLVHVSGTREAVESWTRVCSPVRLAHWINSRGHGELDLDFRVNRTYYAGPEDMYFQGRAYPGGEVEVLGAAEYLWNINAPGSVCLRTDSKRPYTLKPWADGADTPDQVRKHEAAFSNPSAEWRDWQWLPLEQKAGPELMRFIERAARHLYGEKAAPYLLRIKGSGCIRWYGLDPTTYPTSASMRWQVQGLEAAANAAEAMVTQTISIPALFRDGQSTFPLHRVIGLYADLAKARIWAHLLAAQEAIAEEQWSRASEALAKAEGVLAAGRRALHQVFARMKPLRRYRGELQDNLLDDLLASLSQARPKLEVLRIESKLRRGLKRFPARTFRPRYRKGKVRVAIYRPPEGKGLVIGAEGIHKTLRKDADLDVVYVDNLKLPTLLQHHCLIFPACKKMPAGDFASIPEVRRFVGQYGGGVYVQHTSVGHPRFPLHVSMFPEICQYTSRVESNRVTVAPTRPVGAAQKSAGGDRLPNLEMAAHPLVGSHHVGETLTQMHYDHMTLAVEGRAGVPVLLDAKTKAPVVVVGQVGRGRVVFDGSIALASPRTPAGKKLAAQLGKDPNADNFEYAAHGVSRELLVNGVHWLCGK